MTKGTVRSQTKSSTPCFQKATRSVPPSFTIPTRAGSRQFRTESIAPTLPSSPLLLQILPPPAGYVPIRTPARKLSATPTPIGGMTGFHMQAEDRTTKQMNDQPSGNLPLLKPDDIQYFDKLLVGAVVSSRGSAAVPPPINHESPPELRPRWRWTSRR